MMLKRAINWSFSFFFLFSLLFISLQVTALKNDASLQVIALKNDVSDARSLITKDRRRTVISTESGKVSAVEVRDGIRGAYRLQFITLEPNSLFLPALLHADMVLYVHTGNGSLNWVDEEEKKSQINVERGDIFSLPSGSVFSLSSSPESKGEEKLRIYAIFVNSNEESLHEPPTRTYSTLSDLVLGFDKMTLQSSFKVPPELIEKITTATKPPSIVNVTSQDETDHLIWKPELNIRQLLKDISNKRKPKAFNILKATPDFQNCNGWSKMANRKDVPSLKHLNLGVFMVNLTKGSLMGPYWNPIATEIAIVVHGQGMVHIVCSSRTSDSDCKNKRFKVGEGDVFVVPPFHLTAQISFNNNSFVIMGFSTMAKKNHPEFLAGKRSMLRKLDRDILAKSMNVSTSTIDELLSSGDSMISDCTSCAEEEIQRERQERKGEQMKREQQEQEEETETEEEEEGHRREGEEEQRKREEQEAETEEEVERRQEQRQRRQGEEEEGGEQEQETETEEEGERRQEEKQRRQGKGEEGGGSEDE